MKYLNLYIKTRVWLSDHRIAHAFLQFSPLGVLLFLHWLGDKGVICEETASGWTVGLAAAWFVLWITHLVLLKISTVRSGHPEHKDAHYRVPRNNATHEA